MKKYVMEKCNNCLNIFESREKSFLLEKRNTKNYYQTTSAVYVWNY